MESRENAPRRENGITVRYLAQTIINRTTFPDGRGIDAFVASLVNHHNVGKDSFTGLRYYFFLHLEDYFEYFKMTETKDKSEIDLVLWNEKAIIPVEVKTFTDANSTDVKREIVRNTLQIEAIIEKCSSENDRSDMIFRQGQKVYPVLLYSSSYQQYQRRAERAELELRYFNENFLLKMGQDQRQAMATWSSGKYPVPEYYTKRNFTEKVEEINRRLFFTTWEKVRQIHLGSARTRFRVDMGFGDVITGGNRGSVFQHSHVFRRDRGIAGDRQQSLQGSL